MNEGKLGSRSGSAVGSYYNADRSHSVFGGRTPDEVYAMKATEEKFAA